MYVTLEPCQMCSGAIVQSRMTRVVVGCMNPKAGCAGSILNLLDMPEFNHQVELTTGVMEEECSQMMKSFFKELREARKKKKPQKALDFRNSFLQKSWILSLQMKRRMTERSSDTGAGI